MDQNINFENIKAQASSWSLQGDADMLECLVKLSQDVIQKAEGTSKKTDTLCVELDRTNCDLLNVSNHFSALANKQYIESRVADEEPVAIKPELNEPTESAAEKNKHVREEIVRNCLAFLDEFFEEIETMPSSENAQSKTILKAKAPLKPYCRLPYIIGSKEYEEDDFVGLKEPSNLVTSPDLDALPVDERWESSSEAGTVASSEDASQRSNPSSHKSSFVNELPPAALTGMKASPPISEVRVSQPKIPSLMSAYDQREPPPLFDEDEAEDGIFGSGMKFDNPYSQHSKVDNTVEADKQSLFDDDEDLFGAPQPVKKEPPPIMPKKSSPIAEAKPTKKLPAGAVSLFGDKNVFPGKQRRLSSSSESSAEAPKNLAPSLTKTKEAPPAFSQKSGLFSDDSDDSDIFSTPAPSKSAQAPKAVAAPSKSDEPDDLFAEVPKQKVEPVKQSKEPAKKPVPQVQKKLSLFGDSESDEDIFTTTSKPLVAPSKVLFDDDDVLFQPSKPKDDSLFLFSPQKSEKVLAKVEEKVEEKIPAAPKPKIQEKPAVREPIKKPPAPPKEKPTPVNLFDSPDEKTPSPTDDSEDLFGEQKSPDPIKVEAVVEEKKEKAKANEIAEGEKTPEPELSKLGAQNMKRRGLALNINPLALLPGSKPLKTPKSPITPPSAEPVAVVPHVLKTPPVEEVKEIESTPELEPKPLPEATTPDAASFDVVPSGAPQLSHLGKERIRIKQKRKPPTRRGQPSPSTAEPTTPTELTTPVTDEEDPFLLSPSPVKEQEVFTSPEEKSSDLGHSFIFDEPPPLPAAIDDIFGDDDDIFADPLPETRMPKVDSSYSFEPPPLPTDQIINDNDLFAEINSGIPPVSELDSAALSPTTEMPAPAPEQPKVAAIKSPEKPAPRPVTPPKDIFGTDDAQVQDDIFGADDDIFSAVPSQPPSTDLLFEASISKPVEDIFQPSKSPVKQESPKNVIKPAFQLDEDSDSDDLFGPSSAPAKKIETPVVAQPPKLKSTPEPAKNDNLFSQAATSSKISALPKADSRKEVHDIFAEDDEDEDIFAPRDTNEPVIEKKKEAPRQIFDDDDDLFGEPPAPAAKKKPLKKPVSTSLFGGLDDEEDELFGASARSQSTTSSASKSNNAPKTDKSKDFEDPLLGGLG